MGRTMKDVTETEIFYSTLGKTVRKLKGQDFVIAGDFNAKLGKSVEDTKKENYCNTHTGSFARGIRNENGDYLYSMLTEFNLIACNTFFKHRACHITTWEGRRNNLKIFNQIDYIIAKMCRKTSMINARSYFNNHINTDHRLVVTKFMRHQSFERPTIKKRISNCDKVLEELSIKQKDLRRRIYQSNNTDNILKLKKYRNRVFNAIKKRKAFLLTRRLLDQADEINTAKDSAKSSLALKKILPKKKVRTKMPEIRKLTKYFESCFYKEDQKNITLSKNEPNCITNIEVEYFVKQLKNKRASGPDGLKSEDLKSLPIQEVTQNLNNYITRSDPVLTHGLIAPILKPGKDPTEPSSYRPIILFSVYRKLLSKIVLHRIRNILNMLIDKYQYAYQQAKSTTDVILIHKLLIAGCLERTLHLKVVGIDMSKAFDTVNRHLLLKKLEPYLDPGDYNLVEILLTNSTMTVKKW